MTEQNKSNRLAELMKERGGFIGIREALDILGPEDYTFCLADLLELNEDDEKHTTLFCNKGDNRPTHIAFSSAAMEWFCDIVDSVLEQHGVLSPRTKGVKII